MKLYAYFCEIEEAAEDDSDNRRLIFQYCGNETVEAWPASTTKPERAPAKIPSSRAKLIRCGYSPAIYNPRSFIVNLPKWARKPHHYEEFARDVGLECQVEIDVTRYNFNGSKTMQLVLVALDPIKKN